MDKKPPDKPASKDLQTVSPAVSPPAKEKKKLSLDITDVSEVLERKISP